MRQFDVVVAGAGRGAWWRRWPRPGRAGPRSSRSRDTRAARSPKAARRCTASTTCGRHSPGSRSAGRPRHSPGDHRSAREGRRLFRPRGDVEGYNYDSVCTGIDTGNLQLVTFEMLVEAGVHVFVNTLLAGAIMDGSRIRGAIVESRSGREAFYAQVASWTAPPTATWPRTPGRSTPSPTTMHVCNSVGIGNVDIDKYYELFSSRTNARSGQLRPGHAQTAGADQIVRAGADTSAQRARLMAEAAKAIGISMITTTVHDNYLMFIKCNLKLPVSPTSRDEVSRPSSRSAGGWPRRSSCSASTSPAARRRSWPARARACASAAAG